MTTIPQGQPVGQGDSAGKSDPVGTRLQVLICLNAANLVIMIGLSVLVLLFVLPKLERAVRTTERVEARFQQFADEVQPVLSASSSKAVETIQGMDAERLSKTATESSDKTLEALGELAKQYLEERRKNGKK